MENGSVKDHTSFALLPIFTIGIKDSINPCTIASVLIFIIYLSRIGYTKKRVMWSGALFILIAGVMNFFLSLGLGDFILTLPIALKIIRAVYLLLAGVFIILGILNILDWWRYKAQLNTGCFRLKMPVFLREDIRPPIIGRVRKYLATIKFTFYTIFLAAGSTFLLSIYPQDEYIFILYSFLASGGDHGFAIWSFIMYSIALIVPLIITWFVIIWATFRGAKSSTVIAYYKGISAALFLSTGIGLGYYFLALS